MTNVRNLDTLNAQVIKLNEINVKKKKLRVADNNETFVNIESIKAAKDEQARHQKAAESKDLAMEARKTANQVASMVIEQMSTIFS